MKLPSSADSTVYFPATMPNKATSVSVGTTTTTAFVLTALIQIVAAIVTGGSMELMWSMVNTLQIIYYIGLMSLLYPAHVNVFFDYLAIAVGNNAILSYITTLIFGSRINQNNPTSSRFEALGMQNNSFIGNASDKLPILFGILVYFIVIVILMQFKCLTNRNNFVSRQLKRLDRGLRYNFII